MACGKGLQDVSDEEITIRRPSIPAGFLFLHSHDHRPPRSSNHPDSIYDPSPTRFIELLTPDLAHTCQLLRHLAGNLYRRPTPRFLGTLICPFDFAQPGANRHPSRKQRHVTVGTVNMYNFTCSHVVGTPSHPPISRYPPLSPANISSHPYISIIHRKLYPHIAFLIPEPFSCWASTYQDVSIRTIMVVITVTTGYCLPAVGPSLPPYLVTVPLQPRAKRPRAEKYLISSSSGSRLIISICG